MIPPMVNVQLTGHLHSLFPDLDGGDLAVDATTVAEVVREVDKIAPGLAFYVCDERGRLRPHVNVFIGQERVVDRQKLTDPVEANARVFILQALSGG